MYALGCYARSAFEERQEEMGWIAEKIIDWAVARQPDFVIGGRDDPYLWRWWLIPRNKFFNIYVHLFLRSDDDRALHDHPWVNASWLLEGAYIEHTIAAGGIHSKTQYEAPDFKMRWTGRYAHRIEIDMPCWTLFITGPRYREWGFHCPDQGWIHWRRFTAESDIGAIGPGCEG